MGTSIDRVRNQLERVRIQDVHSGRTWSENSQLTDVWVSIIPGKPVQEVNINRRVCLVVPGSVTEFDNKPERTIWAEDPVEAIPDVGMLLKEDGKSREF